LDALTDTIEFGASPRASIDMIKAVKASAYLRGNDAVSPVDIALCVKNILRHRISLSYDALASDVVTDDVIDTLMQQLKMD